MNVVVPATLAALAVAAALAPADTSARLPAVVPPSRRPPVGRREVGGFDALSGTARRVVCLFGGLGLALLVGDLAGLVLGTLVAVAGPAALGRLEPRSVQEARVRFEAELPLALELLAACLAGGAALVPALRVVAEAVPGPCGRRLAVVAAALDVGSPPQEAWQRLVESSDEELAASAARTLARASDGGAPVAAAVAELSAQARRQARARGQQAAERAGVLAVLPLGLCFLPAFVVIGVVPLLSGLVAPLLAGL